MAASIGQLDRHVRGWRLRHWIKKQTSGRARRQAKRYLDNAPSAAPSATRINHT